MAGAGPPGLGERQDVCVGGLYLRRHARRSDIGGPGPDDIVKRLKVGLEPLAGYDNHDGLLLCSGSDVMYEHSETWRWPAAKPLCCRLFRYTAWSTGK
ncbi:putative limonene-1,2-epoxide hydrolase [Mycobacterium xenopi 4042]|uniref:Putative limonene-1,2-epoxide hydrolase n=1 Tax=Mycobacterium xenopi 4042 TaxID=1299334 RepID=X8BHE2_MYCXE|nr:putative limonene-1,2-epoxide hydrolase [Mycobacterium xenopi 4042]